MAVCVDAELAIHQREDAPSQSAACSSELAEGVQIAVILAAFIYVPSSLDGGGILDDLLQDFLG